MRHVVMIDANRTVGVPRVNTALRQASEATQSTVTLGDVASRAFTIVQANDIVFDVIRRVWRRRAIMALVVRGRGIPRPDDVAGVITPASLPRNMSPAPWLAASRSIRPEAQTARPADAS